MITAMQKEELSTVMRIWLKGNLEVHDFLPDGYWQGVYEDVQEQIQQAEVFVWKTDDKIQGFIGLQDHYLAGLFVEKTQQKQGMGKALLQFAQQEKKMLILHVFAENERAMQFYQKQGFEIRSEQQQNGHLEYEMQWCIS